MIPQNPNTRRRWQRPGPNTKHSRPGEEYVLMHRGKEYRLAGRFVNDPTSPDGQRWIAAYASKPIIRRIVCELAGAMCEMSNSPECWKSAPVWVGHPHHVRHKKMGNAFGDDRIFLEIDGQTVRIRVWGCPVCHRDHHNKLHWSGKPRDEKREEFLRNMFQEKEIPERE